MPAITRFLRCILLLGALTAPDLLAAQTPTADTVGVDTSAGYARLSFSFQKPAAVNATVADGVLTVHVSRPVDGTIEALVGKLGGYVASGRRDSDGLTYRFALSNPVTIHSSTVGAKSVVDLVPANFKGTPPDLPPPPPPPAKKPPPDVATLPAIKVRVGEYANFTRLVFDWPKPVDYSAYPGQGRITVRFQTLARPDFSMLTARAPAWVKSAGWHIDGDTTVVDFDADPSSGFHDFKDGTKVVIDVLAPKTDASAYVPPLDPGAKRPSDIAITQVKAGTPPPVAPAKGTDAVVAAQKNQPAPATAKTPVKPDAKPEAKAEPAPAPPLPAVDAAQTATFTPSPPAMPNAELTRDGAILHFPQAKGHGTAVFVRGQTLWIVLDAHPELDAVTLLANMTGLIDKAEAHEISGASVLQLNFKTPLLAAVSESDTALDVALSATTSPPEGIALTRQGADGLTSLSTPLAGATHALEIEDAEAHDRMLVVPARPGHGMLTPKHFVEMDALQSSSGIVVVPRADDIQVSVAKEIVTFSRPQGLALSSSSGASNEPVVQAQASKEGPAFIEFQTWGGGEGKDVFAAERSLRATIAKLPESESNKARLRLARYLIAHELAPEALGEVAVLQGADQKLANDPGLMAIKGAAQYMMGRYADARVSLSGGALANDAHAALWRGLAEAKLNDWGNARRDLAASQSKLRLYPADLQTRARLARAEVGLAQGDLASANDALDQLPPKLPPRDNVESKYLAAQLLAAQGHVNEAVSRLRALEHTDYAPIAAKATYARVDAQLASGKIKHTEAVEALEQLRYRWRGDDLELKTLRKLGSLYIGDKKWRDGLTVLRIAALNFPNSELARSAQDDMRKAFSDLFLGNKADTMPPIEALSLFYEFIELTPIGSDGDEMIRRLSDRLVAVDLLGPAEQLLDHQVTERLDGVAKAVVATKLAVIYLLDHKFQEALKIINDTRQTRLPDDVNAQRRLLEARALAGLKQYDAAVDLVADDDSAESKRLRADIYWESGNWTVAGTKTEDMLGERWNLATPLTADERGEIMRAAVAYSLGGDDASLQRLKAHYAVKMSASPDAKAFGVVTESIDQQGVAFRDLAKKIAAVDTLQAFMADFKKQGVAMSAPKTAIN